jgi:hypothetical protein
LHYDGSHVEEVASFRYLGIELHGAGHWRPPSNIWWQPGKKRYLLWDSIALT